MPYGMALPYGIVTGRTGGRTGRQACVICVRDLRACGQADGRTGRGIGYASSWMQNSSRHQHHQHQCFHQRYYFII